jgi:hypothetical protein
MKKFTTKINEGWEPDRIDSLVLVMLNNIPCGLVKNDDNLIPSIEVCLIESQGYEEIEIDDIEIAESIEESVGNPCRVDGSRINLHLIYIELYEGI